MKTNELRDRFLNFFKGRGHTAVPSDSLIPSGDPTLLFTSAGMVQFKKHFLAQTRLDYTRAASCQKCLRTSDIDRVGVTARHHTFFEMLGNFSFGDYFKKEAIGWGWEFLTKECGLDADRLYPSIYKEDDEAAAIWKTIVPDSRIIRLGEDSNFWNMGPTGPCGPCSEILYDQGEKFSCGKPSCAPGCDCDRYLEVWNLVFTQFDRQADGSLKPLPQKNIDTGMGLERLSAVVNAVPSNFDIDTFRELTDAIKGLVGDKAPTEAPYRMIADHARACTFLISDGILPSNDGRGYILRRLLRRAARQGWVQGRKEPFLSKLVPVIARNMSGAYPELIERSASIQSIIETEEANTLQTIETGTQYLLKEATAKGKVRFSGEKVFFVYETFGLDKEIQKEILSDAGVELEFSEDEYKKAKEKAAELARKGWKGSGEKDLTVYSETAKKAGPTAFKGYETLRTESEVKAILKREGNTLVPAAELKKGEEGDIVLSETPFYAESGGQAGDQGRIFTGTFEARVTDTQKPVEKLIVHSVKVVQGTIKIQEKVSAEVDQNRRGQIMRHHTATHLLHAALRRLLGTQVSQAGSLVTPDKLRFDFTYPKALTPEQITTIENDANAAVRADVARDRNEYTLDEARKRGALAFFGDKYGERVFVVHYGEASTEVCGGTHCRSTGEVGFIKVLGESSVGSGVRRIEAVAGEAALDHVQNQERTLRTITDRLRCSAAECPEKIEKLFKDVSSLEKEVSNLNSRNLQSQSADVAQEAKTVKLANGSDVKIIAREIENAEIAALKETSDLLRDKIGTGAVVLASRSGGKTSFVVAVTKDAVPLGLHAGKIASSLAKKMSGKGGGKEFFAQGGGPDNPELPKILETFPEEIAGLK